VVEACRLGSPESFPKSTRFSLQLRALKTSLFSSIVLTNTRAFAESRNAMSSPPLESSSPASRRMFGTGGSFLVYNYLPSLFEPSLPRALACEHPAPRSAMTVLRARMFTSSCGQGRRSLSLTLVDIGDPRTPRVAAYSSDIPSLINPVSLTDTSCSSSLFSARYLQEIFTSLGIFSGTFFYNLFIL